MFFCCTPGGGPLRRTRCRRRLSPPLRVRTGEAAKPLNVPLSPHRHHHHHCHPCYHTSILSLFTSLPHPFLPGLGNPTSFPLSLSLRTFHVACNSLKGLLPTKVSPQHPCSQIDCPLLISFGIASSYLAGKCPCKLSSLLQVLHPNSTDLRRPYGLG